MERYDGDSALHFLSHNFEGHEIIEVTMWGNPVLEHHHVQDILTTLTMKYAEALSVGGNIRLAVENMGKDQPCVYHIDMFTAIDP